MLVEKLKTILWRSAKEPAIGLEVECNDMDLTLDLELDKAKKLNAQLREQIIKEEKRQR